MQTAASGSSEGELISSADWLLGAGQLHTHAGVAEGAEQLTLLLHRPMIV